MYSRPPQYLNAGERSISEWRCPKKELICLLKIRMDLLDDDDVSLCTSVRTGDVVFVAVRLEWTAKYVATRVTRVV
jgi:hypothetical protein